MAQQVLVGQGPSVPAEFAASHKSIVADKAVQFTLEHAPVIKPPQIPEWLNWLAGFGKFLDSISTPLTYIFWGITIAIVMTILFFVLRELGYIEWLRPKTALQDGDGAWAPGADPARALLAEADALAALGKYEEAAHLLLLRSVEDIETRLPDALKPSSTAREIARSASLPEKAQTTFALIARHVEASLFGGRTLNADAWLQCRDAYGRFALAGEWR